MVPTKNYIMKTIIISTQLAIFLILGAPVMAQSTFESTFANATSVTSSSEQENEVLENELLPSDEEAYEQHTLAAQEAIRAHLVTRLSYSDLLYDQGVVGRVILVVDLDAEAQVSAKGVRQNLSTEADAVAMEALVGLTLAEGPYLGARTILVPVDFVLE